MEINETNKKLYELAFIENGEYGYHFNNAWKPSIDEREIENSCCDENGNYVPATPLGYRDYTISRLQGIANILDQNPCVDLRDDKYHQVKRVDNTVKMYDKIVINDEGEGYVVVGDDDDMYYVVNRENKLFSIKYIS